MRPAGRAWLAATAVPALVASAILAPVAPAAGRAPVVQQLIVQPDGGELRKRIRARGTSAKVGRRRCRVAAGTTLAALARFAPARIELRDFGSCGRRARDGGQLFVTSINGARNRGRSGWVYKVGHRLATAGAGDPGGPFGRGRLRGGADVTWFYCVRRGGSCQRTLGLRARIRPDRSVLVAVRGHDDEGRGVAVPGATVRADGERATTDDSGRAVLALGPGRHTLRAFKDGLIQTFGERVTVR